MKAQDALRLKAEIEHELSRLATTRDAIESRRDALDDTTTYALALLVMNYYTGAERIFQRIATALGGLPPPGPRWHQQLLEDMQLEISGVRPAVLSEDTAGRLIALMRFRHAIRNLYAWTIRRSEMEPILASLSDTHREVEASVARFGKFLDSLATP